MILFMQTMSEYSDYKLTRLIRRKRNDEHLFEEKSDTKNKKNPKKSLSCTVNKKTFR